MLVRMDTGQLWAGEPLNGMRHPANIYDVWTKEELNAIGLAKVQPFVLPDGMSRTGEPWFEIVDGVAVENYTITQAPPPAAVSDRQFFQALALAGVISQAEALAAVKTGEIPAVIQGAVDQLPEAQRFSTLMLLSGATIFERHHPMTVALGQLLGWTEEAIDDLFRQAGRF